MINNTGGTIGGTQSILFTVGGALNVTGDAVFDALGETAPSDTTIEVNAHSIVIGGSIFSGIRDPLGNSFDVGQVTINATNDITIGDAVSVSGGVHAGGNVSAGHEIFVDGTLTAGESIVGAALIGNTVAAGGDITIRELDGSQATGIFAASVTAGGTLFLKNAQTLESRDFRATSTIGVTPGDFALTVGAIVSTGPTIPQIFANGDDFDLAGNGNPGNGGNVTVHVTSGGLTIGSNGDVTGITADGGGFNEFSSAGGNGGAINIITAGDFNLLSDGRLSANSGTIGAGLPSAAGAGGTINVTSGGTIAVNSLIQVSSDDSTSGVHRRSTSGGNIGLTSSRPSGVAINVDNSGQLLSLLDQAAPGPGGTITILATGTNSQIQVKGNIEADRGRVDIRHTGANGVITLGSLPTTPYDLRADVVKVGALGANGTLNIGGGSLTANSVIKLYAPSSNGQLNFINDVTLTSGTNAILAAGDDHDPAERHCHGQW